MAVNFGTVLVGETVTTSLAATVDEEAECCGVFRMVIVVTVATLLVAGTGDDVVE